MVGTTQACSFFTWQYIRFLDLLQAKKHRGSNNSDNDSPPKTESWRGGAGSQKNDIIMERSVIHVAKSIRHVCPSWT